MPALQNKTPVFLSTLRDHGWEAARSKRGGNVAKVVAAYLSKLDMKKCMQWLAMIDGIPVSNLKVDIVMLLGKYKIEQSESSNVLLGSLGAVRFHRRCL